MSRPRLWTLKPEGISVKILGNQVDEHGRTVVVVSHDRAGGNSPIATITLCDGQVEQEEKDL